MKHRPAYCDTHQQRCIIPIAYPVHACVQCLFYGDQSLASAAKGKGSRKGGSWGATASPVALRLSNDGIVTSDVGCGRLERARREKARALRFRAVVFVNGSKVIDDDREYTYVFNKWLIIIGFGQFCSPLRCFEAASFYRLRR